MKKIFYIFSTLLVVLLASCSEKTTSTPTTKPTVTTTQQSNTISSIEIQKNNVDIDELNVEVGDEFNLVGKINDNLEAEITWESSNPSVVSINTNGHVTVHQKGDVIITVCIKNMPFISDSIIVHSKKKVEQTGVGSGLSKEDPIFKGNEGEDEPLEIYFIEMQHIYADSIFIKKGNVEILIDAGYEYDGQFVNKVITQYCTDDRLDLLMLSHSDGDHVDGLATALSTVDNISLMVDYGGSGSGNVLNARNKYKQLGMQYHSAYDSVNKLNGASDIYYLTEDFYFEVLNTGMYIQNNEGNASNPHSLAVIFYYKDFTFFTGGDITSATEEQLLKNEDLPEVTLFKSPHHGSHGSNSQEFLDTLNPKAVAISAARANNYQDIPTGPNEKNTYNLNAASGHPAAAAIERIYKAPNIAQNLNVYWNAVNGTMKFVSYGRNDFEFYGSPTMKGYYDLTLTGGVGKWNAELQDFENRVTGEEQFKLHESKVFVFRNYIQYLPEWARKQYFPDYTM